jgi:GrpB-like predicted nucleotidyltransferase (UPF0157 family)
MTWRMVRLRAAAARRTDRGRAVLAIRVVVVPYDAEWPRRFAAEAERLRQVFGPELVAVHHIGSTAVPGLAAKPIIDIMPVVRRLEAADERAPAMRALGYEAMGEFGIAGRRYFRKGGDRRTHHVHVFRVGDPNVARHLAFRDYLRAHPEVAAAYGALKRELAARHPEDIEAYMDGKDAFVRRTEAAALRWWRPPG